MPCFERAKDAISTLHIDVTNASVLGKYQNSNLRNLHRLRQTLFRGESQFVCLKQFQLFILVMVDSETNETYLGIFPNLIFFQLFKTDKRSTILLYFVYVVSTLKMPWLWFHNPESIISNSTSWKYYHHSAPSFQSLDSPLQLCWHINPASCSQNWYAGR